VPLVTSRTTEVDVQGVAAEVGEQVLAVGEDLAQHPAVEQAAPAAKRPCGLVTCTGRPANSATAPGQPVQGVPLRHGLSSSTASESRGPDLLVAGERDLALVRVFHDRRG
jgi:hypothetical protein